MHTRVLGAAIALAAVLFVGCGGSSNTPTPVTPSPSTGGGASPDVTITIVGMNGSQSFSPNPATVKVGQTVAWRNADSIAHDPVANGGQFNVGVVAPGSTSNAITMSTAGSFDYHCGIHPSMVGTLTVSQ